MLKIGSAAPTFSLKNQHGKRITNSDFIGTKFIVFFYPADNTPTCTIEACNLAENFSKLKKAGYKLIGVSPDSEKKHLNFIAKFQLPFDLLCDTDLEMTKSFKVWGEKQLFGKKYNGVLRTTFVINEKGKIEHIIDKVKSKEHAKQLLTL